MRWVIVSEVLGEAGKFNKKVKDDIFYKFKARASKLPAHFTIKTPFDSYDILNIEKCIMEFSLKYTKQKYIIDGFDHFHDRVVYMNVKMSKEAKFVHDKLMDELEEIGVIFGKNEDKSKIFHVTVASKNVKPNFVAIWNYVLDIPCYFEVYFDNISIYKWENNTWVLYRYFPLNLLEG